MTRRNFAQGLRRSATLPGTRRLLGHVRKRRFLTTLGWWAAGVSAVVFFGLWRSNADSAGFPVHGQSVETNVFGTLPTLWLQDHVYAIWPDGLSWSFVVIHGAWFFTPIVAAALVTIIRPSRLGSLFAWWIGLNIVAHVAFTVFPLEPPWLASSEVVRIIEERVGPIEDSNQLAAMPSFHVALPLLFAFWFFRERWYAAAAGFGVYAALVAAEVVISGEHHVLDAAGAVGAASFVALVTPRLKPVWAAFIDRVQAMRPTQPFRRPARQLGAERGQALIEFAAILPILLIFLLVLVDFGMAIDQRQVIQHAAREGARKGAVGWSPTQIENEVIAQAQDVLEAPEITVCYTDGPDAGNAVGNVGDNVRVSIDYTYEFSLGSGELLNAFSFGVPSIDMTPHAEARLETTILGATACP